MRPREVMGKVMNSMRGVKANRVLEKVRWKEWEMRSVRARGKEGRLKQRGERMERRRVDREISLSQARRLISDWGEIPTVTESLNIVPSGAARANSP